jgi:Xaa-Pro aminopeptidase
MIDTAGCVQHDVLAQRIGSLQQWGQQQSLDALVVFGHGSVLGTATRSHGNLRYLLDWDGDAAVSALILPTRGSPALVVANIFAHMRAQELTLLMDARFGRGASFAATVIDLLPQNAKRIGLAGRDEIPVGIWEPLAAAGASAWVSCEAELARRRAVKDALQIAYHRQAGAICDHIFEQFSPALHTGHSVADIQAELEKTGRQLGCEYCKTWLTVRPIADRCRYLATENLNVPQAGDQALLGIMLIFHGHWGHAIRTGSIGTPTAAAQRVFKMVEDMHVAMLDRLRPGADLRAVGQAGVINDKQLGQCFQFRGGHALGYSYEDPIGSAEFPQPYDPTAKVPTDPRLVEPGMLFEIHPNLFVEGYAGASIGDMALVTDQGPELLTKHPRHLLTL